MEKQQEILNYVPEAPAWTIAWETIEHSHLASWVTRLKNTMQNPVWHSEGDVWTHTRMTCEALVQFEAFQKLNRRQQQVLFLAALLHDFGKAPCTKLEDGVWVSPYHAVTGARIARQILWLDYGFCGTQEMTTFRETICNLIRYHAVGPHILDQKDPWQRLIKIASNAELTPDFSINLLILLEEADMTGRIANDAKDKLEDLELCRAAAQEADCLDQPVSFPDSFSEYAYLKKGKSQPGQFRYDDTWGEVILMSGLPGTGKDTWILEQCPTLPMISLDEIRRTLPRSKTNPNSLAASEGKKRAREYLRQKQSFVWNATSLTPAVRSQQIQLFESYGASVRIVYLETPWENRVQRNAGRSPKAFVPEGVVIDMLSKLVLPERFEAQCVEWRFT